MINKYLAIAMVAAMSVSMASCSDDDAPGKVTEINGKHLTAVGDYSYKYDDKGRVTNVYYDGDADITIDYDKNKIYFGEDEDEVMEIKFNGDGFITEMKGSWDYTEGGEKYKGEGKIEYSYKDKHLKEVKFSDKETTTYSDGSKEEYKNDGKGTFTWTNGNLVKLTCTETEVEDGDTDSYEMTFAISYDNVENKFQQFPYSLANAIELNNEDPLYVVGLFGNGTNNFPTKISVDDDGDTYEENFSFTLNEDGTIASERNGWETIDYFYTTIAKRSGMAPAKEKRTVRNFFVKKNNKK